MVTCDSITSSHTKAFLYLFYFYISCTNVFPHKGDNIIDSISRQSCHWGKTSPMEVVLDFPRNQPRYPKNINYVHVLVKSNTQKVDIDVRKGGIGEAMMKLKITAYGTQLFNYEVQVYGV